MSDDQNHKFNFTTECFFATHYALRLGFHVIHEKMGKLNQELVRFQRVYENARMQGVESSEIAQRIKENMEKGKLYLLKNLVRNIVICVTHF